MAMLALNDVFEQVWSGIIRGYPRPETEFWTEAVGRVRHKQPGFLFLGEVYWSLEKELHKLGFDYTYDKNLYDRLRYAKTPEVLQQLNIDGLYQPRMVRFIENHDEPRAVVAFGQEKSLAAAAVITTLPGLRFIHDGQMEGKTIKLPVQLGREPEEQVNNEIKTFYEHLLAATNDPAFHDGEWHICEVETLIGNPQTTVLAWYWQYGRELKLVTVNYSDAVTQCRITLPPSTVVDGQNLISQDILTGQEVKYSISDNFLQMKFNSYQVYIINLSPNRNELT